MGNVSVRHALVLAGGRSRRMGMDKAALAVGAEDQLARTVALARECVPNVYVSVRADQRDEALRARYPQVVDRYSELGPLAGIMSALEFHRDAAWLIVACDLPALDVTSLSYLVGRVNAGTIATAFAAEDSGLPEPLCAVWMPAALGACHEAVAVGTRCPRKILIQHRATLLELPTTGALANANTPDDFADIKERINQ